MSMSLKAVFITMLAGLMLGMVPSFDNANQHELYGNLTQSVRCLVCQNQSVADSSSPFAAGIRQRIAKMVAEGKSSEYIEQTLVEHYGEKVLFRPAKDGRMWLLWYGPFVLLVFLGGYVWVRQK